MCFAACIVILSHSFFLYFFFSKLMHKITFGQDINFDWYHSFADKWCGVRHKSGYIVITLDKDHTECIYIEGISILFLAAEKTYTSLSLNLHKSTICFFPTQKATALIKGDECAQRHTHLHTHTHSHMSYTHTSWAMSKSILHTWFGPYSTETQMVAWHKYTFAQILKGSLSNTFTAVDN